MEEHSTADSHNLGGQHQAVAPPYISFNTFRTLLDWLKSEGVPLLFDRSFWHAKFSGGTGTQLVAALRFLGLLDGDRPLPDLESMATASVDERRFILAVVLKDSYSVVPFDELDRATPAMLRAWFRAYPIDGHTTRKAISFFINAAKEAELPMSNAIRKMAKNKRQGLSTGALIRDKNSDAGAANAAQSSDQRPLTMPAGSQGSIGRTRHGPAQPDLHTAGKRRNGDRRPSARPVRALRARPTVRARAYRLDPRLCRTNRKRARGIRR